MSMPGWLRALIALSLAFVSLTLAWFVVTNRALQAEEADLTIQLDTNRQRVRRQEVEYAAAVAELPGVTEELQEVEPQAEDAAQEEAALRQERKDKRAEAAALEERLSAAQQAVEAALPEAEAALDAAQTILDSAPASPTVDALPDEDGTSL